MFWLGYFLIKAVEQYPDKIAVKCGEETYTYSQLWEKVINRAYALCAEYGIAEDKFKIYASLKKKPIPFRTSQSIDFLVEYLAIHVAGGVAVPLDKDMLDDVFLDYQRKLTLSGIRKGLRKRCCLHDVGDVLFTTGTTGKPKGVMIGQNAMDESSFLLSTRQEYSHDLHFIVTGPLNHFGNLSKIYPVLSNGATLHIIDGMKNLNVFFETMDREIALSRTEPEATRKEPKFATFLVPASIRMLLTFARDRLASYANWIDFIETGAAPISQADMKLLCAILPKSRLYNTYASTEIGVVSTYNFNCPECLVGCVGHVEYLFCRILDPDTKEKMKRRKQPNFGEIACGGRTLFSGYYDDEELTRSSMHHGLFHTSDLGEMRSDDYLFLKGRMDDVINVGGYKVAPTEVEDAALALPGVKDCICIPAQHQVLGTVLKLLVVLLDGFGFDKRQIALMLKEHLESYKVPTMYEQVESINRTYNGKLDRKSYTNDSSSIQ